MSLDRDILKTAAVALLDSLAREHPLGHQQSKGRRYILSAPGGTALELMFEQDADTKANLWAHAEAAGRLASMGKSRPASDLWTRTGKDGKPLYGRHSALETMPQLGAADLVVFPLSNLAELGAVLDQLWNASAAGVKL